MHKTKITLVSFIAFIILAFYATGCSLSPSCDEYISSPLSPPSPTSAPPITPTPPIIPPQTHKQIININLSYMDESPMPNAKIISDNPLVPLVNAYTNSRGFYQFETNLPEGTVFTLSFEKTDHIISTITFTIGKNGILQDPYTTLYVGHATGYIPLSSDNSIGKSEDALAEDINLLRAPIGVVASHDGTKYILRILGTVESEFSHSPKEAAA